MGLGVLEDKVLEHVPGTTYVFDDERRSAEETARDVHSKRDKTGQIILVPQPSDSPNDPLVTHCLLLEGFLHLLTVPELAIMEARSDTRHSFSGRRFGRSYQSPSRCRFRYPGTRLPSYLHRLGATHRLPSLWGRRGRLPICSLSKNMGEEASIPVRMPPDVRKLRMGWVNTQQQGLQEHALV